MTKLEPQKKQKPLNSSIFHDYSEDYSLKKEDRFPSGISSIRNGGNNNFFGSGFSYKK